jgi:hypothetical protein
VELRPGEYREERRDRAVAEHVGGEPQHHAAQLRRVDDVAQADTHRTDDVLGRERGNRRRAPPEQQHADDAEERSGVEQEDGAAAHRSDEQSAERGPDRL